MDNVPLLSIQVSNRTEALHLNLLWKPVLHLYLSQLPWQEVGFWEGVRAARCDKLIRSRQEHL